MLGAYFKLCLSLQKIKQLNTNIMKSYSYYTKTQGEKEVILFDKAINNNFIVEVNVVNGYVDKNRSYKFNTLAEATKKYNSIVKRVSK